MARDSILQLFGVRVLLLGGVDVHRRQNRLSEGVRPSQRVDVERWPGFLALVASFLLLIEVPFGGVV